jgi:asparagine synthase (glutamine-hydrolysing)
MCGFAATVNCGTPEQWKQMGEVIHHRGPDDCGEFTGSFPSGDQFALISARLAIIDLSKEGHMPMLDHEHGVYISYNGEVYNFAELREDLLSKGYTFHSKTDTEVVLKLYIEYGKSFVKKLRGMFAFAIADTRNNSLFCARDQFGIKPLYYWHNGKEFACASEIKSLLCLDIERKISYEALQLYLTFLWVPDPNTMFEGIWKLPAGYTLEYKDGKIQLEQYWDLEVPADGASFPKSEDDLAKELRERFDACVKEQLVSDVPVGAFLSAGLDSNAIVESVSRVSNTPLRTFTIAFDKKYRVGENTTDDPSVAAEAARAYKCIHEEIIANPTVGDLLPRLIYHLDEPIADPAIIMAYLVSKAARKDATVLLSGVGGDELFAGYRKHAAFRVANTYRSVVPKGLRSFIQGATKKLPAFNGTPIKGMVRLAKKFVDSASLEPVDYFLRNSVYMDSELIQRLCKTDVHKKFAHLDPLRLHKAHFAKVAHGNFLNQMLYVDTKTFMISLNLTYNDKMTMAPSVEGRFPFLDVNLAQFAMSEIPPSLKLWQQVFIDRKVPGPLA